MYGTAEIRCPRAVVMTLYPIGVLVPLSRVSSSVSSCHCQVSPFGVESTRNAEILTQLIPFGVLVPLSCIPSVYSCRCHVPPFGVESPQCIEERHPQSADRRLSEAHILHLRDHRQLRPPSVCRQRLVLFTRNECLFRKTGDINLKTLYYTLNELTSCPFKVINNYDHLRHVVVTFLFPVVSAICNR